MGVGVCVRACLCVCVCHIRALFRSVWCKGPDNWKDYAPPWTSTESSKVGRQRKLQHLQPGLTNKSLSLSFIVKCKNR